MHALSTASALRVRGRSSARMSYSHHLELSAWLVLASSVMSALSAAATSLSLHKIHMQCCRSVASQQEGSSKATLHNSEQDDKVLHGFTLHADVYQGLLWHSDLNRSTRRPTSSGCALMTTSSMWSAMLMPASGGEYPAVRKCWGAMSLGPAEGQHAGCGAAT